MSYIRSVTSFASRRLALIIGIVLAACAERAAEKWHRSCFALSTRWVTRRYSVLIWITFSFSSLSLSLLFFHFSRCRAIPTAPLFLWHATRNKFAWTSGELNLRRDTVSDELTSRMIFSLRKIVHTIVFIVWAPWYTSPISRDREFLNGDLFFYRLSLFEFKFWFLS